MVVGFLMGVLAQPRVLAGLVEVGFYGVAAWVMWRRGEAVWGCYVGLTVSRAVAVLLE